MSWGQKKPPEPPKAFADATANHIDRGIYQTGLRIMYMYMKQFDFDELRELFIPEDMRDTVTKAYAWVDGLNTPMMALHAKTPGKRSIVRFRWAHEREKSGFFVPRKWGGTEANAVPWLDTARPALIEKYEVMAENLERVSREWGLIRYVFHALNRNGYCNTAPQMRYVWPALPTILGYAGLTSLAKQYATPSARAGDKARIPPNAAPYIRETYDIVTRSILMDLSNAKTVQEGYPAVDLVCSTFHVTSSDGNDDIVSGIV